VSNPFYHLAPGWARIPMVVLATFATIIASQAVISGAYSVSRQAVRLGYLPNLAVLHTSTKERGQIYVPAVNWALFAAVLVVIALFRSSSRLATAYGLAVTATFVITTTLFITVAARVWHWPRWRLILIGVIFGSVEVFFFAANVTKVASGGWLPLVIAVAVTVTMTTWQRGRQIVTARRVELEGSLAEFIDEMRRRDLPRVPGVAVFPHPTKDTTPLALRANVDFNKVLHEHVVLISVQPQNVPYIAPEDRIEVDPLNYSDDGIVHLTARFGFQDEQDLPELLRQAVGMSDELTFDPEEALYFLSRLSLQHGERTGRTGRADLFSGERRMWRWRKRVFIAMAHNAANPASSFHLPEDRTILVGAHLEV
jgi:KUP system potassium uptake protein